MEEGYRSSICTHVVEDKMRVCRKQWKVGCKLCSVVFGARECGQEIECSPRQQNVLPVPQEVRIRDVNKESEIPMKVSRQTHSDTRVKILLYFLSSTILNQRQKEGVYRSLHYLCFTLNLKSITPKEFNRKGNNKKNAHRNGR